MSDVFISYGHSTSARQAGRAAAALRALGYSVWLDDDLPAHRAFSPEIEAQLTAAKAAIVIWSAEAAKSHWVLSEANLAREADKLVQLTIDGARLPMPFDQIQCADLSGWSGDGDHPGWAKVAASVAVLVEASRARPPAPPADDAIHRETLAPVGNPLFARDPRAPLLIAVLPFSDLSATKDQGHFCDGMVVEIAAALSRYKFLSVVASAASLAYKNQAHSHRQIADELGVRYLLDGSVRRAGDRVRITVELTDVVEGARVWSHRFDGVLEDVLSLQDEVAAGVVGQIGWAIHAEETARARARSTRDPSAYDLFLRGGEIIDTAHGVDATVRALDLFEQAIDRDPSFTVALAAASRCHAELSVFGSANTEESRRIALQLAGRALAPPVDDPAVLTLAAEAVFLANGDLATADGLVERAIALNPNLAPARALRGRFKLYAGLADLGLQEFETALRLNPRSPERTSYLVGTGNCLGWLGRHEEALASYKEAALVAPTPGVLFDLAITYARLGRVQEAKAALDPIDPEEKRRQKVWIKHVYRDPALLETLRSSFALVGEDL